MAEVEAEPAKRRRKRSSSRKKAATWPEYWRSAVFGRHLFIAMVLVGAGYAGSTLWSTRQATHGYGPVWLQAMESEVRYMLGPPDAVEAGGTVYRYSQKGREYAVRLSAAGQVESISCSPGAEPPATCPKTRGLGIGTTEDRVLLRLGAPSRVSFHGNDKALHYDGMGLTFQLSLFKVRAIEVREGASFTGYFPRALLAMIP